MAQFQKRPVVIEAMEFRGVKLDDIDYAVAFDEWLMQNQGERVCRYQGQELIIPTLEGDHTASAGDWIIKGVAGELYPCKPAIFAATYRPAPAVTALVDPTKIDTGEAIDITDIDAISFSARVAQVAAAELFGLLSHGEPIAIDGWFVPEGETPDAEALSDAIETMAAYALKTKCGGEQLFRSRGGRDWAGQSHHKRLAFDLFASTMAGIGTKLVETQRAVEAALEFATRPNGPGLKREDSIFEDVESLGTMRPEAVEAEKLAQENAKKFNGADPAKFDHDGDGKPGGSKPKTARRGKPKPMSVGEAPAKPPVNRGGRGRRKPKT